MTADLHKLLDDLRLAGEGSRELGDRVLLAMGWRRGIGYTDFFFPPDHPGPGGDWDGYETDYYLEHYLNTDACPNPTYSLDDAVGLVPRRDGSNKAGFLAAALHQTCVGDIPDERLALVVCERLVERAIKEAGG